MKVKTFCTTCIIEHQDYTERLGSLFSQQINDDSFLVTILFLEKCGHRRIAILNKKQIEAMEVKNE
jgi:hypothetical protein